MTKGGVGEEEFSGSRRRNKTHAEGQWQGWQILNAECRSRATCNAGRSKQVLVDDTSASSSSATLQSWLVDGRFRRTAAHWLGPCSQPTQRACGSPATQSQRHSQPHMPAETVLSALCTLQPPNPWWAGKKVGESFTFTRIYAASRFQAR